LLTLRGPAEPRRGIDLGQLHIIEDGAVLIENGVIVEVGPSRRLENLAAAKGAVVLPANGRVVMPAFVDAETHSLRVPASADWVFAAPDNAHPGPHVPGPRLRAEAERTLEGMLRYGTTTAETPGRDTREIRAMLNADSDVELVPTLAVEASPAGLDLMKTVRSRGLARSVYPLLAENYAEFLASARALDLGTRVLLDVFRGLPTGAAASVLAVTGTSVAAECDTSLLGSAEAVAILAPGVEFHSGASDHPPARRLVDCGAAVALATGYGPSTNPSYSMSATIALACRFLRLSPAEAVAAATLNAAYALGCGRRLGSLEPGKQADLLILDTPDYRALAWELGVNVVFAVMKRGRIVYDAEMGKWRD
jgi:imidazolonepropionase